MVILLEITAIIPYSIGSLLVGGATIWVAVVNGWIGRKKTGAETAKIYVETSASEQKFMESRIEFLTKQAKEYEELYTVMGQKYKMLQELSDKKERECELRIDSLQLQVNTLQQTVMKLTAMAGLK